jgi:hypothetical protein
MFIFAGVITVISFLISNVNLINYTDFNRSILSHNIEYKYNLVIPKSDSYIELKNKSLISRFYFVEDTVTKRPIIIKDKKEITFKEISKAMSDFGEYTSEYEIPYITYQLHIHKGIKMKYVNPLIREFSKFGSRVGFAVSPKSSNRNRYNSTNYSFRSYYYQYSKDFNDDSFREKYDGFKNIIRINQNDKGSYKVNNVLIKEDKTTIEIVKREIQRDSNYLIVFYMDLDAKFSSYINILSTCRIAVSELRDTYSQNKYLTKFESLSREQKSEVYEKFPVRVYELFKYKPES